MFRFRVPSAFALAALVVLFIRSEVPSQPGPGRPSDVPTPLAVVLLPGIDDPAIVAELKLSQEQVKTLVAHRQKGWDEAYITAPKKFAETAAARTEATDALMKKTLSAAQHQRAVQLGAQRALSGSFGGLGAPTLNLTRVTSTVLNRYPELATAFKLTDEQKKELGAAPGPFGGLGRSIALKPEQTEAAKEFLGPLFAKRWAAKSDVRLENPPTQPSDLTLLAAKDVLADVKATEGQVVALNAVRARWTKLADDRTTDLSPKDADAQAATLQAESEKVLAATLDPKQVVRLKQIAFQVQAQQRSETPGTHIEGLYKYAPVAKELTLSDRQVEEFTGLWTAFHKDATTAFDVGEPFAATEKRLKELAAARRTKAEAILTTEQTAKLKSLFGEPFTGSAQTGQGGGFNPLSMIMQMSQTASFGKYATEFGQLAGNKAIQDELKMTAEQVKQAFQTRDEVESKFALPSPFGPDPDAYSKITAERSKAIEVALGKTLTVEQAKRFREIMLQSLEQPRQGPGEAPAGGFNPLSMMAQFAGIGAPASSAAAYPGVAEVIRLTGEQKTKLLLGTPSAEVLTTEQKAAIAKMLGQPFTGSFAFPSPVAVAQFGRYSAEFTQLAGNKTIQDELKMTADQVKQAVVLHRELQPNQGGPTGGGFNPLSMLAQLTETKATAERVKAIEERSKAIEAGLGKVLTGEQAKRFREIMLQSLEQPRQSPGAVPAGGFNPLSMMAQLAGIGAAAPSAVAYPGVAEAIQLTDVQKTKLLTGTATAEVLTADQKTAITKMLGQPFTGDFTADPTTPTPSATARLFLLRTERASSLDEVLKLSPEQAKNIAAARAGYGTASRAALLGRSDPEVIKALTDAVENLEKVVTGGLTPEQTRRVAQLLVQSNAASSLVRTLTTPEMVKTLDLTPDQTAKLTALSEDAVKLQDLRVSQVSAGPEDKLAQRLRDAADERMLAVLTAKQKAKWKDLIGEPWTGLSKTIPSGRGGPPGGGFGGFGP